MKLTEKQKNCKYCHPGSELEGIYRNSPWDDNELNLEELDNGVVSTGRDTWGDISFNPVNKTLTSVGSGVDPLIVSVNYCPMCGRPLNEEEEE